MGKTLDIGSMLRRHTRVRKEAHRMEVEAWRLYDAGRRRAAASRYQAARKLLDEAPHPPNQVEILYSLTKARIRIEQALARATSLAEAAREDEALKVLAEVEDARKEILQIEAAIAEFQQVMAYIGAGVYEAHLPRLRR